MKIHGVLATTHIDRHGMRFTKKALEAGAVLVNGPRKPTIGVEHDRTVPPLGKILAAWVEPTADGEYKLMKEGELFEGLQMTVLPDGTRLLKQECEADRSPFLLNDWISTGGFALAYDRMNFADEATLDLFLKEVKDESGSIFDEGEFYRKSLIPDPEIIVRLSSALASWLISRKFLDRLADKTGELVAEDLASFHSLVKAAVVGAAKYVRPSNRPITYVFELAETPFVEFIVQSAKAEVVMSALTIEKFEAQLERVEDLSTRFEAERIQFLLNEHDEWELNYLLTAKGAVIGTEKSFRRRDRRISLMSSTAGGDEEVA